MIGKPYRFLDGVGAMAVGRRCPLDEHDGQAENARGDDLALGGIAAGILADDHVDAVVSQKRDFRLDGEGAAGEQVFDMRRLQRRIDRIDAAHEIMVLRSGVEGPGLLPADRKENAARFIAQGRHGRIDRGDARPAVAVGLVPTEAFQPQERHASRASGGTGIVGNLPGEGMRRVDQEIDGLFVEIGRKPVGAAEAAAAHRHGLRGGIERPAGKRERDGEIRPFGQPAREIARLGRAAQYEDASLVHA